MKRTTGRTVARTFVVPKELKSAKRQKDTEEDTCQCLVSDEPFVMLLSHCGEYPCECKKIIFAASGEYMANGLTNAIRHQFAMIAK